MAKKPDVSGYERFSDVTGRLDEIISAVRDKDTSLERSLDLFDEAIALGTKAVDLVDKAAFSPEERERLAAGPDTSEGDAAPAKPGADGAEVEGGDAAGAAGADTAAGTGADADAKPDTPAADKPASDAPAADKPASDAPADDKPTPDNPAGN